MRKTETYFICDGCSAKQDEAEMLSLPMKQHGEFYHIIARAENIALSFYGKNILAGCRQGPHHVCLNCQAGLLRVALDQVEGKLEKKRIQENDHA